MTQSPKIFILSPHFDDAAYSLTLTISKLIDIGASITIINCFTITKWTALPVENKDVTSVSKLRATEDLEYSKLFNPPINVINLDLLDAPLRNGYIFQNQPFQPNEQELIEELKKLLLVHVDGILFCPLAIGNHIDHAICREAVTGLYHDLDVIFFEDLPYTQRIGEDQVYRHIHKLEEQLGIPIVNETIQLADYGINKEQAIQVYKSQLNEEIAAEIIGYLHAIGGERLWGEAQTLKLLPK
jgi:LmbE family N-acetylglucosaminyl deacetylase